MLPPHARGRPRAQCLTLLCTQLVGFLQPRALHDRARLLTAHDRVLLPAIRAYRGRRITSRGASVLAAFASPTDAVLCGIAIQDLLGRQDATHDEHRISIRLAVHLGETRFRLGRLVGRPVELVRSLCHAATPGEVWLTRAVHLAMNHVEVTVDAPTTVGVGASVEQVAVYQARRSGELTGARDAALAAVQPGRLERVLEPISDAIASVEDGAALGRISAVARVACATVALALLGAAEVLVLGVLGGVALAALLARRARRISAGLDRISRWISAARPWLRSRRAIPRAALIRPLW